MTYAQFNAAVRAAVSPDGEAENLVENHKSYVLDALIDLQIKVPRLQENHTDFIPSWDTLFHCGASLFSCPRGFIVGLSTMLTTETGCCDEIAYKECSKDEMDCLLKDVEVCNPCCGEVHPYNYYQFDDSGPYYPYPTLEYCTEYPQADIDKVCRARDGYFTLYRSQLWVTPHLQSNEVVKLSWDGVKRSFADADVLDPDIYDREVQECVELYLRGKQAGVDDCDYERGIYFNNENPSRFGMYQVRRADLIHSSDREQRLPKRNYCFQCT
jgi:hypothetical protein